MLINSKFLCLTDKTVAEQASPTTSTDTVALRAYARSYGCSVDAYERRCAEIALYRALDIEHAKSMARLREVMAGRS